MIITKYSNDEDFFQSVLLKSMEVYEDPTDFKNLTGQEQVDFKIVSGFERTINK